LWNNGRVDLKKPLAVKVVIFPRLVFDLSIPIYCPFTIWQGENFELEKNRISKKLSSIFVKTNAEMPKTIK
jgi:hypothetical protein